VGTAVAVFSPMRKKTKGINQKPNGRDLSKFKQIKTKKNNKNLGVIQNHTVLPKHQYQMRERQREITREIVMSYVNTNISYIRNVCQY